MYKPIPSFPTLHSARPDRGASARSTLSLSPTLLLNLIERIYIPVFLPATYLYPGQSNIDQLTNPTIPSSLRVPEFMYQATPRGPNVHLHYREQESLLWNLLYHGSQHSRAPLPISIDTAIRIRTATKVIPALRYLIGFLGNYLPYS